MRPTSLSPHDITAEEVGIIDGVFPPFERLEVDYLLFKYAPFEILTFRLTLHESLEIPVKKP